MNLIEKHNLKMLKSKKFFAFEKRYIYGKRYVAVIGSTLLTIPFHSDL